MRSEPHSEGVRPILSKSHGIKSDMETSVRREPSRPPWLIPVVAVVIVALLSGGLAWGLSHHGSSSNEAVTVSASESATLRFCLGLEQLDDGTTRALEAAIAHDHVAMAHAISLIKLGSSAAATAARETAGLSVAALASSADGVIAAVSAAPRGLPHPRAFDTPVTGLSESISAASAQAGCTHLPATRVTPGARRSR
jgi:hypothetical protein